MLLNYLKENLTKKDPDHVLACFKALGHCGSNTSVPFLRSVLLGRAWSSFIGLGKLTYREGAAIALALLDTPKAKDVLLTASKSRFAVIRSAFAKTKDRADVSGEKTNG